MAKRKEWIGIILLVIVLIGFVAWETWGRDRYRTTEVIVAAEEIPAGTLLEPSLFLRANVETKSVMEGALRPEAIGRVAGMRAAVTIPKNAQIAESSLRDSDYYLADGEAVFVLKGEWISLRSSSLRRGDWIDLYSLAGAETFTKLGTYRVSFVKDANESEVKNTNDAEGAEYDVSPVLSRTNSTAAVCSVEIIATAKEYAAILDAVWRADNGALDSPATVKKNGTASLMLVQVNV
ncbi:MAG: SAF domain-containing protein [Firmicutes bacterium]|nr:SAF domain-containing protein [Bacillota bacterium]